MSRLFVVISGLPGSGKSTLGRRLASALGVPLLDKDDILERLFLEKGTGGADWRRALSRESDTILQDQAAVCQGAVLVSFWRVPGMAAGSGTPTEWLRALPGALIHLRCVLPPPEAARRFSQRTRHPGHLDSADSPQAILRLAHLAAPELGARIDVDTAGILDLDGLVEEIRRRLKSEE